MKREVWVCAEFVKQSGDHLSHDGHRWLLTNQLPFLRTQKRKWWLVIRKRCIAKIQWKQRLDALQLELNGFCGHDRSIGINLVLQWGNASFASSTNRNFGKIKKPKLKIDWVSQFFFFFCEGTTEVRFVERIVHRHIVQNSSCRNILIEQIFARTGIKFLNRKTTYLTLYSKLDSKETSTPSEAYCTVLNYI